MAHPPAVRSDPELARLAAALDEAAVLRVWLVARHLTRQGDGSGVVALPPAPTGSPLDALKTQLAELEAALKQKTASAGIVESGVLWRVVNAHSIDPQASL